MTSSRVVGIRSIAVACVILAFTLAASLGMAAAMPGNAYAGSKTNVYVVSKIIYNSGDYTTTSTYSYKNGLITKVSSKDVSEDRTSTMVSTFTYNSKNALVKKANKYNGKNSATTTYKTNSKGWVTKVTIKYASDSPKNVTKYTYKGGKLVKASNEYGVTTYKYSDGKLKTYIHKSPDGSNWYKAAYTYDKKGGKTKCVEQDSGSDAKFTLTYKNTYKNGRLAKQVAKLNGDKLETVTYTYKKVAAPKSLAKMVKAQQRYTVMENVPFESAHK